LPGTTGTVTYKYDPFGRRVQKAFTQGGTTTTTNYLYDGSNLLEEVDSSGNVLARYTEGPGTDEPLAELRSGTTSYYQQDGLNSISSLSTGAGALANTYSYDSFGKLTGSTGTLTNPFQYTAREFDSETGIYEYRFRYFDQNLGRFLNEDPIGFRGGTNFYNYAANSPNNLIDPLGLMPKGKDKWWGHNNRDFQRWFHRCWKQQGDPDASKGDIQEAYDEWVSRGKPTGGNCGGGKQKPCEKADSPKTNEDQQWSDDFWQSFWDGVHEDQWNIENWIRNLPGRGAPGFPVPPPLPIPVLVP
jgi:RHS repeat-associated protein